MRIVVIDTETTGLPGRTPPELLRLTELGAVVVDTTAERRRRGLSPIVSQFTLRVDVPPAILRAPECQEALAMGNGTLRDELHRYGGAPLESARRIWQAWTKAAAGVGAVDAVGWTSYNRPFDEAFLTGFALPWPPGRCLMQWATAVIDRVTPGWLAEAKQAAGKRRTKGGHAAFASAAETVRWLGERKWQIPSYEELPAHRALPDATREAWILLGLLAEDPEGWTVEGAGAEETDAGAPSGAPSASSA